VTPPGQFGIVHRDLYTMRLTDDHQALSVMMISEGNVQWAIRYSDLGRRDPPVYTYYWANGGGRRRVAEGDRLPREGPATD
jgi:hypothetical protein